MTYLLPQPPPQPRPNKKLEELKGMAKMAETDEGLADLLDKARMYYALKKPILDESNIVYGQSSTIHLPKKEEKKWWKIL